MLSTQARPKAPKALAASSKPKTHSSARKRKSEYDAAAKKSKQPSAEENTESAEENTKLYMCLGGQKRASIGTFKGHTYVDTRKYYGLDEKPTKQGITLNKAQWEILKVNFGKIDRLLAEATK
ncbi:hypothetical protein EYR38_001989 [Pleurotus pulmonarius]|nr:hypothetical protein EYR38_001989 [Pleurotus pulmonarius]